MFDSAKFHVSALVRWANEALIPLYVEQKGHESRGLIYLKQRRDLQTVRLWVQTSHSDGTAVWRQRFEEDVSEEKAEEVLAREKSRDEDLWIVTLEDPSGHLPPVLQQDQEV